MKYYYYISDAKVNMLLPQIGDVRIKKISKSLGVDFKVFSVKRDVEYETDDRIARLEAVVSFIREFGELGTVDKPDKYIEDSLPMTSIMLQGEIAYFTGSLGGTVIGLGGSKKHLIGAETSGSIHLGGSVPNAILKALSESSVESLKAYEKDSALFKVKRLCEFSHEQNPLENLRFMAKRLLMEKNGSVILASPLYVTKED